MLISSVEALKQTEEIVVLKIKLDNSDIRSIALMRSRRSRSSSLTESHLLQSGAVLVDKNGKENLPIAMVRSRPQGKMQGKI